MYRNRTGWSHLGAAHKEFAMLNKKIWCNVQIPEPISGKATEIFKWLEEEKIYCVIDSKTDNGIKKNVFWFVDESDAIAFKLRWL